MSLEWFEWFYGRRFKVTVRVEGEEIYVKAEESNGPKRQE